MIIVKNKYFSGFTLIEMVVVVLLLGILSVFAMGRMFDQNQFAAKGFFDDTVTAVRFAQKLAVSTGCDVQVTIDASGYSLNQRAECPVVGVNAFNSAVKNPANRANNYANSDMPSGYRFSPGVIVFNAQGLPNLTADKEVELKEGETGVFAFTVYYQTGLVDVVDV